MMNLESKNKLVNYLNKKGINIQLLDQELIWNYIPNYSKFLITLYSDINDDSVIKYHSNIYVKSLNRRRTVTSGSFCNRVYKNLLFIKAELDKIADEFKIKTDLKKKYCTELELYYKRLHKSVNITTMEQYDSVSICVDCGDTFYYIIYKNNKYYLNYKTESINKIIDLQ